MPELYNFFTEPTLNPEDVSELRLIHEEIKYDCESLTLVETKSGFSLIGQKYGSDTNVGDLDLLSAFHGTSIKYYWFNAFNAVMENNLK